MLGHFLDDQHRLEVAQSLAAELLRNGHAEHSAGAQALDVIPWVSFGAVDFGGARRHVRLGERAGARLKLFLGRRELEIHGRFSRPAWARATEPSTNSDRRHRGRLAFAANVTTNGARAIADRHEKE